MNLVFGKRSSEERRKHFYSSLFFSFLSSFLLFLFFEPVEQESIALRLRARPPALTFPSTLTTDKSTDKSVPFRLWQNCPPAIQLFPAITPNYSPLSPSCVLLSLFMSSALLVSQKRYEQITFERDSFFPYHQFLIVLPC